MTETKSLSASGLTEYLKNTQLTHFPQEETCQVENDLQRCHHVEIVVLNDKQPDTFSSLQSKDWW